jgi:hypothetical protein
MTPKIYRGNITGERCLSDGERLVWLDTDDILDACLALLVPGYGDAGQILTDRDQEPDADAVARELEDCTEVDPVDELRSLIDYSRIAGRRLGVPHQGTIIRWLDDDDDGHDYARVVDVSDVDEVLRDAHGRSLVLDALAGAI